MVHAPTALTLARLKREPLADLPLAGPLEQAMADLGHGGWRERLPLDILQWLLQWLHARAAEAMGVAKQLGGPRGSWSSTAPATRCPTRRRCGRTSTCRRARRRAWAIRWAS
jgi:hypothetical protein